MKLNKDKDYDFSIYADDEPDIGLVPNKKKSNITTFRSKFSPGEYELEGLSMLKSKVSEYGIKVASNTDDISDLWNLYACLNNYWSRIKPIFGSDIFNKISDKDKEIRDLMIEWATKDSLDYVKLHAEWLKYRDMILEHAQYINLGIEVERTMASQKTKAKDKLVQ